MVCGVKLRSVMSSIMRRRKGVMCGSFASEREGKWEPRPGCRIGAEKWPSQSPVSQQGLENGAEDGDVAKRRSMT